MNFNTPRLDAFTSYMMERHRVYKLRKEGFPPPWTHDPIIAGGRFCNIFRELDTVTIWIRKNIRERFADHPDLWFMLCIARYINWPQTLALLQTGDPENGVNRLYKNAWPDAAFFDPKYITAALEDIASTGDKVYTGAYMIRAESDPNKEWYSWTKHRYIAEIVLGKVWEKRNRFRNLLDRGTLGDPAVTLERVWAMFQAPEFTGWGPFMAYEVVTDLRHTRYLRNAPDIYTWANAGPGAIRGLNRLYGRDLKKQPTAAQTNSEMLHLQDDLNLLGNYEFGHVFGHWASGERRFEMRDVEHTLCEFDKYERVRLGEGKMRSKYDPKKATKL